MQSIACYSNNSKKHATKDLIHYKATTYQFIQLQ